MAEYKCSRCGKKLELFSGKRIIRYKIYCRSCSRHYRSDLYDLGVCYYHQQWLQDYDNICYAYETGSQVHPDELYIGKAVKNGN